MRSSLCASGNHKPIKNSSMFYCFSDEKAGMIQDGNERPNFDVLLI